MNKPHKLIRGVPTRVSLYSAAMRLLSVPALAQNKQLFERTLSLSAKGVSILNLNTGPGSLHGTGDEGDEFFVSATVRSKDYADIEAFLAEYDHWMLFGLEKQAEVPC